MKSIKTLMLSNYIPDLEQTQKYLTRGLDQLTAWQDRHKILQLFGSEELRPCQDPYVI
jgi:hypothetical protein